MTVREMLSSISFDDYKHRNILVKINNGDFINVEKLLNSSDPCLDKTIKRWFSGEFTNLDVGIEIIA